MQLVWRLSRWLVLLPASAAAAWATYIAVKLANGLLAHGYIDPSTPLAVFWIESISSFAMGGVFIYVGFCVAPAHKVLAACTLLAMLLVLTGVNVALIPTSGSYIPLAHTLIAVGGATAGIADLVRKHGWPYAVASQEHTDA